jgi:hypothetical protein
MNRKPRIAIVSSYGNPLAINIWIKFFEKYWMDVVDEVYIVAGGNKNFVLDNLSESNQKLCEYYNTKHNNNKLNFIFASPEYDDNVCSSLTSHAHLLYNGTRHVGKFHNDATIFYVDDDMYIKDKNTLEKYFGLIESGQYAYAGQVARRLQFSESNHILGWFVFCDLKTTLWMIDQYNSTISKFYDKYMPQGIDTDQDHPYMVGSYISFKSEMGNIFGQTRYYKDMKFDFVNYTVENECIDEVFWLFSKFLRLHYGVDKEYVIPEDLFRAIHIHDHIPFDDQVEVYRNSPIVHVSGNYQQHHFLYKNLYFDYAEIDRLNLFHGKNIKLLVLLQMCIQTWDLQNKVDDKDIYTNIKNYMYHVYTLSNLDPSLSKEKVEKLSQSILEHIL